MYAYEGKVQEGWKKWCNEEPREVYSRDIIRLITSGRKRWAGYVVRREIKMHTGSLSEQQRKRLRGRPKCRWEDIKTDLQQTAWICVERVNLTPEGKSGRLLYTR
jgi:hypothetical protein